MSAGRARPLARPPGRSLGLALLLLAAPGLAEEPVEDPAPDADRAAIEARRPPRESAWLAPAGTFSVGIFNPLRYSLTDTITLEAHPLAFFLLAGPHLGLDWQIWRGADQALVARFGLATPAWALRLPPPLGLNGYLAPSCAVAAAGEGRPDTCEAAGPSLVPSVGARWTLGRARALTLDADVAVGVVFAGERPAPLDTYAPLNLALGPLTHTWRAHLGVRVEEAVTPWLRVASEVDLYRLGAAGPLDPWVISTWIGADLLLSDGFALTVGIIAFAHDQGAIRLVDAGDGFSKVERARSLDFYPTLDALWTW